ncbi:hypothetical protein HJC99_06290 [Candidatus Saccharibacteria bacterium]|nr:hypothetical protein [Candidatus Saccharibacteria bacterium]
MSLDKHDILCQLNTLLQGMDLSAQRLQPSVQPVGFVGITPWSWDLDRGMWGTFTLALTSWSRVGRLQLGTTCRVGGPLPDDYLSPAELRELFDGLRLGLFGLDPAFIKSIGGQVLQAEVTGTLEQFVGAHLAVIDPAGQLAGSPAPAPQLELVPDPPADAADTRGHIRLVPDLPDAAAGVAA